MTQIEAFIFYQNALRDVHLSTGATSIGVSAFEGNELGAVSIPSGVTSIGRDAFRDNSIVRAEIPDGNTSVANGAFAENYLRSVTIPDSVSTIDANAFYRNRLSSVSLPSGLTVIGNSAFAGNQLSSLVIPAGVSSVGSDAFQGNNLESVSLSTSLSTIGSRAFRANDLQQVEIPADVAAIGSQAFSDNPLAIVRFLGDKPGGIAEDAFVETGTDDMYYKASAAGWTDGESISSRAMRAASPPVFSLQPTDAVVTAGGETTLTAAASAGAGGGAIAYQWSRDAQQLDGETGASVTTSELGSYVVEASNWVGSATSSSAVVRSASDGVIYEAVGDHVRATGCVSNSCPTSLTLADTIAGKPVTTVFAGAFQDKSVSSVTIPSSVTLIGNQAFAGNAGLSTVRFLGDEPSIGDGAFSGTGTAPLYHRTGTAGWTGIGLIDGRARVAVAPPTVTGQPASGSVVGAGSLVLSVTVDPHVGGGTVTYQWLRNSVELPGKTSRTLAATDAGSYTVRTTTWAGQTLSNAAVVTKKKANQSATVALPTVLKRGKVYRLPKATSQKVALSWSVGGAGGCKVNGSAATLTCTKSTGNAKATLTGQAVATSNFNALRLVFARKVG